MNLSGFVDEDNTTFKLLDINVTEQPQQSELYEQDEIRMLQYVMAYTSVF